MPRRLSIGVRWALRYTAVMAVTLGVFALFVQGAVARRINREAFLLTEVEAHALVDSIRTQTDEHSAAEVRAWLAARLVREVEEADPELGLGLEFLDAEGRSVVAAGSLLGQALPVPHDLLRGEQRRRTRAVNLGGEHAHLVTVEAAPGGFVRVAVDGQRYAENVDHIRDVLLGALPVVLLGTALLGWGLARGSLEPIAKITRSAQRITGSNLQEEIATDDSGDELDELAGTLNQMILRIRENVERIHRFNSNAAHELSTPLNAIRNQLGVTLDRDRDASEYRRVLEDALDRVEHLSGAVESMLRLSRTEAGLDPTRVSDVELGVVLEAVVEFFAPVAADRGIELGFSGSDEVWVRGDPAWLQQAFSNLIDNAIKYGRRGDQIRVEVEARGDQTATRVADTGPGIPAAELETIFDRFQRSNRDRSRPGFGLGLALVREIASAHGGRVEVESEANKGTCFTLWLPNHPGGRIEPSPGGSSR
ncbi:MAG: HAMP domain-containing protein [Deltaproteobacteria bacterium]|nr:HAMP domain-containing protein [Deltaproteobacteria bacterium]